MFKIDTFSEKIKNLIREQEGEKLVGEESRKEAERIRQEKIRQKNLKLDELKKIAKEQLSSFLTTIKEDYITSEMNVDIQIFPKSIEDADEEVAVTHELAWDYLLIEGQVAIGNLIILTLKNKLEVSLSGPKGAPLMVFNLKDEGWQDKLEDRLISMLRNHECHTHHD